MNILRRAKENVFVLLIAAAYIVMFIVRPDMGVTSVQNSVYYIKEMILIMPVIFVLTALLDTWVPKEQIMRLLGKGAGWKSVIFSLVLGSISAGPIYAAFPLCVMLHKKGASIRNMVVILSAWAVIKVPMLLNEMKFLGFRFMAVRWMLTVIAILIFSWITAKIISDKDLPKEDMPTEKKNDTAMIAETECIGCAVCARKYPELFGIKNKKAYVKSIAGGVDMEKLRQTKNACPVQAIVIPGEPQSL